ncbi:3-oxoacyl-[acyl-carrier-protein] synthase 2 [Geothrix limicola]|uniref:3-oxoacyl-[acyl-carrier-protein] synthase 2 n=1 Tax=Geothrix limicola TaxID=2927978 RepID=A0ABQ5QKE3_9BACT|nr:beta-ketoacyl-ACP synthase II [Geothrix limicola]GLH75034.1 3-oxoacyl-[acyl-carrier-protein] synthase 2 [Geothrix limicola]
MRQEHRVVVTGMGTANPLGLNPEVTWRAALEARSGVGPITRFDPSEAPVRFAAEVRDFEPSVPLPILDQARAGRPALSHSLEPKDVKKFGRYAHLGIYAGLQAYIDSGLDLHRERLDDARLGVNVGCGMGGLPEIQETHAQWESKGYRRISPFFILQVIPNLVSGQLALQLGFKGPNHCNVTACATSAHAIGESFRMIKQGIAQVMLAGGAESVVCEIALGGFAAMKTLSLRNEDPAKASRPFDADRNGFVLGEGATVLMLEDYEFARRRGARIYGEILGYGASSDAHHLVSPPPGATGALQAMMAALSEAGVSPDRIDYVNAHATSTPLGDREEARAIGQLVTSSRSRPLHVSSTKGVTGHLLGAAGATEAMFSLLSLRDQIVPPTANLDRLDPDCDRPGLEFVRERGLHATLDLALSNSFGFGGTNGALLFGQA